MPKTYSRCIACTQRSLQSEGWGILMPCGPPRLLSSVENLESCKVSLPAVTTSKNIATWLRAIASTMSVSTAVDAFDADTFTFLSFLLTATSSVTQNYKPLATREHPKPLIVAYHHSCCTWAPADRKAGRRQQDVQDYPQRKTASVL